MKDTFIKITALFFFLTPVYIASQWQTYNTPVNCRYWGVSVVSSNIIWAAGQQPGTIIKTTDAGMNWLAADYGLNDTLNIYHIFAIDANTAWASGGGYGTTSNSRLFKTTNGGLNWIEKYYPNPNWINKIHFFDSGTGVMFVDHNYPPYGDTCGYIISRDGGTNWYRPAHAPVILSFEDGAINVFDTSFITFTAARGNGQPKVFFRLQGSLDGQWESFGLPSDYPASVFFKDYNTGFGCAVTDSIYKTTNAGVNWFRIAGGGSGTWGGMSVPGTNWLVIYASNKILLSNNFGALFQTTNTPSISFGYGADAKDTNSIWISGIGGKLYKYNFNFIGIKQISTEVPKSFILHQNYPNPFNPTTKIEFELPRISDIEFAVYDAQGRQVYNITEQNNQPGKFSIDFNGTGLASGVYFYRLTAGDFIATKKMVILK